MADVSDVETALAGAVAGILYPDGPEGLPAWEGLVARVYRGWPQAATLDADLAAGVVTVTVNQRPGYVRNTTRHAPREGIAAEPAPTIGFVTDGDAITLTGASAPGHLVGALGVGVDAVVRTAKGDTLASIAARLAALLPGATASGETITVPGLRAVRVERDAAMTRETRRQEIQVGVTVWAPDREARDRVAGAIDAALSDVAWLPLADGSEARLRMAGDSSNDDAQEASLYRRDLAYSCEYPTTVGRSAARVVFAQHEYRAGGNVTRTTH